MGALLGSQAIDVEPRKQKPRTTLLWQHARCCLPPCSSIPGARLCQRPGSASLAGFLALAADFLAPSLRDLSPFQGWQLRTFKLHSQFLEKNEIMDLKILP